jgi:membrane fusion protein (multidrug efflux system)
MAATFSHSLRSLKADGFRPSTIGLFLAVTLLACWVGWSLFARVTLYEVTDTARLEVGQEAHALQASVAGRVVTTRLVLNTEVQTGDVLVELDAEGERRRLEEERASLAMLSSQLEALRKEVAAEEQAGQEAQRADQAALAKVQEEWQGAGADLSFAEKEVKHWIRLLEKGYVAELDLLHAKEKERQRRTRTAALRLEVSHREKDMRTKEKDRAVRLKHLHSEVSRLEGQMLSTTQAIERLAYEVEKRRIQAPIAGKIGEIGNVRMGAFILEGDRLGAIVPLGELRVIAHFLPSPALGRIRPGQPAHMRLAGFPWTQYGAIPATVVNVAKEIRDGRVRVELTVHPNPESPIPFQHGLPGTVEVEVDHVSPATLLFRIAGNLLVKPTPWFETQPARVEMP